MTVLLRYWWAPVIVVLAGLLLHQRTQTAEARQELAENRAEWAETERKYQAEATAASEAARAAERRHAAQIAAIDQQHQEDMTHADETHDRELAALRAGTLRLRNQLDAKTCPGLVPDAPDSAGEPDVRALIRGTDAANLIRIAERCDAQVRGLQAVVREDRSD